MFKIAFCPTMKPFAEKISQLDDIQTIALGSAGQSLAALKTGQVDGVLIGRYAKGREIDSQTKRDILQSGYTLVYQSKTGIGEDELKNLVVNTYLPETEIQDFAALIGEIRHFDSLEACLADKLTTPILINWEDYRDEFELLIPMNNYGKIPLFRAPVLYTKGVNAEIIEKIAQLIA